MSASRDELLIANATIVDGTGSPPLNGSVLLRGERIAAVERGAMERAAAPIFDASGLTLTPGFIDAHVHSEIDLTRRPIHEPTLAQGVTTHIVGQDGVSYAPMSPQTFRDYAYYFGAVNGVPDERWASVEDYLGVVDGRSTANVGYLVPHGTARYEVSGMQEGPLDARQMSLLKEILAAGFDQGAVGFSSGLSYFPGAFADTAEMVELAQVAAEFGRPYVTHIRTVFHSGITDGLREAIQIAEVSGAALHVSHLRTKLESVGQVEQLLAPLDDAFARGLDVTFDTYPYVYGSGPLSILLPPWVFEGSREEALERLRDPAQMPRIEEGFEANISNKVGVLTYVPARPEWEGRELGDLAREHGMSLCALVVELLVVNELVVGYHGGAREVVADEAAIARFDRDYLELLDRPYAIVGSDGIYVGAEPHERGFGTFPKVLRMAREAGMPLERAVQRMTQNPARRFGLNARGTVTPGNAADLILLEASSVAEGNSPTHPTRGPRGIAAVWVNGKLTWEAREGARGLTPGRAMRFGTDVLERMSSV